MSEPIPSCFRRTLAGSPPSSTFSGPTTTTSIYNTHLGPASFIWSRTLAGLSLHADLRLSPSFSGELSGNPFSFQIRPWFLWKRKGTKHLHRSIDVAWDLTRARFNLSGGPEPWSDFYIAIKVAGEMLLVAGDMAEEAHRKMKARRRIPAMFVSRKDEVFMKPDIGSGIRSYRAAVIVWGKKREILIEIGGKEKELVGLVVSVNGVKGLQVKRIRWKFRGREKVDIDGGIQISWNLYGWLFAGDVGQAVFVFVFEGAGGEGKEEVVCGRKEEEEFDGGMSGCLSRDGEWRERGKGKKKSLVKTRSSSSSSSASSAGSSSVMDWESVEEAELRGGGGFTLVVHAWKS